MDSLQKRWEMAMNRVARWRSWFAAWQLGTRSDTDGECRAVKEHREATILLRAELNALLALLVAKGVFTEQEFYEASIAAANALDKNFSTAYPGVTATEYGLSYNMELIAATMKRLNFPP